ncbi:hypothetical protein NKG94_16110 [Micromonospora sp. M12]
MAAERPAPQPFRTAAPGRRAGRALAGPSRPAGRLVATFTELSRVPVATAGQACQVVVDEDGHGLHLAVDWPDGISTSTRLDTEHAGPTPAAR